MHPKRVRSGERIFFARLRVIDERERPALHDLGEIGAPAAFAAEGVGLDDLPRCEAYDETAARAQTSAMDDRVVAEIDDAGF